MSNKSYSSEQTLFNNAAEEKDTEKQCEEEKSDSFASRAFFKKRKTAVVAISIISAIFLAAFGYKIIAGLLAKKVADYEELPILYLKNGNILMVKEKDSENEFILSGNYIGGKVQLTDNGKIVFYAENLNNTDEFDLYYRKLGKKNEKGTKIESNITSFCAAHDGSFVLYEREKKFYINDFDRTRELDFGVDNYFISADNKTLFYTKKTTAGFDLYICSAQKDSVAEKLESSLTDLYLQTDKETGKVIYNDTIYFKKDGNLYIKKDGSESKLLVHAISKAEFRGETLFCVAEKTQKIKYSDIIVDDCKFTDENIAVPQKENFDSEESYNKAYNTYKENTDAANARNNIRSLYADNEAEITTCTVYRIDGSNTQEIAENIADADLTNGILFKFATYASTDKIALSTVRTYSDYENTATILKETFSGAKSSNKAYAISPDGYAVSWKYDGIGKSSHIAVSEDNKYIYTIGIGCGTLRQFTINKATVSKGKKIADKVLFYKIMDSGTIALERRGGEVGIYNEAYNVIASGVSIAGINDSMIYCFKKDKKDIGTLIRYDITTQKSATVDSNVYLPKIDIRSGSLCYYLKNYNLSSESGELYENNGSESKLIDNDVNTIIDLNKEI